jgi:HlyD family secretion protein
MKKWILSHKKWAVAGACVFAALIIALGIFFYQKNSTSVTQAADAAASTERKEIDAWGEVKYTHMEDISIDFPSAVTDILVKEGDRVTLGQPLITLDLSEYNGNIEKLKQQLAANQAALPAATQDVSALQADIAQTKSEIARKSKEYNDGTNADLTLLQNSLNLAQKQLASAKSDLQSYQALYDAGAVSKATLNQYVDALNQRQKAVDDVQANIQKTKTALKDEINQLNVSLKSKQAQLSQLKTGNTANVAKQQGGISSAQVDLSIMTDKTAKDYIKGNQIVSNIKNGIMQNIAVSNAVHLGVQGAPTKVLQIIDADSIIVSAEVDEEFIGSIKVGETVRIVPASDTDISLNGTVTQIPNVAVEKDGKRVIRVLVKPNDPNNLLKPGYSVDVYFRR